MRMYPIPSEMNRLRNELTKAYKLALRGRLSSWDTISYLSKEAKECGRDDLILNAVIGAVEGTNPETIAKYLLNIR